MRSLNHVPPLVIVRFGLGTGYGRSHDVAVGDVGRNGDRRLGGRSMACRGFDKSAAYARPQDLVMAVARGVRLARFRTLTRQCGKPPLHRWLPMASFSLKRISHRERPDASPRGIRPALDTPSRFPCSQNYRFNICETDERRGQLSSNSLHVKDQYPTLIVEERRRSGFPNRRRQGSASPDEKL